MSHETEAAAWVAAMLAAAAVADDDEAQARAGTAADRRDVGSREHSRSRRHSAIRGRTENMRRMPIAGSEDDGQDAARPMRRSECAGGERPCPFVSCAYHLYLDVATNGSIKFSRPDLEVWELRETCALDVADRGGATLEEVGDIMNLTRERVRQIEVTALVRVARRAEILAEFAEDVTERGRRKLPLLRSACTEPDDGEDDAEDECAEG